MSYTGKAASSDTSGTIKVDFSDIFNSASWKKARKKALAYDPLKGVKRVAKAPPSPNSGEHAGRRIAKKANFFIDHHDKPAPKKPVVAAKPAKATPVAAKTKENPSGIIPVRFDYFNTAAFKQARDYQPKWAKHVPKVPPAAKTFHADLLAKSKLAKTKRKEKPQPSLVAAYTSRPGELPQFEPARVVRNQAQLNDLLAKGNVDLLSAIAYCDRRGEVHTGSVLEIYSMIPG